ncbi:hypothetical protein Tco_0700775 [Tanacetum coccineum]
MKVEEPLNVTFDENPHPTKLSSLVDDDVGEEESIIKNTKVVNNNNEKDESIEVDEILNIKESKNHLLDQVIGNLNQRTLRSQAQNHSTKMLNEYQQDYKKTCAYAPNIYNDPNMFDALRDIYRTLESRYVHEGRTIDPSFYNDLSDDSVAKFTTIGFDCLLSLDELLETRQPFNLAYFIIRIMYFFRDRKDKVLPYGMILTRLFRNLKANMTQDPFDERYKLVPRKMSSLMAKQPKKPPPKRTKNVRKSKHTQLSTPSSTESPSSDNGDLPSTKLPPRSYSRALKDDPNMSKEQRETRGMFKNLGRALHKFAKLLKKGCR